MKTKYGRRKRGEPELMGAKEAAEALGVRQPNLRTVAGLPEPYQAIASTTLWRAAEVRELAETRREKRTPTPSAPEPVAA